MESTQKRESRRRGNQRVDPRQKNPNSDPANQQTCRRVDCRKSKKSPDQTRKGKSEEGTETPTQNWDSRKREVRHAISRSQPPTPFAPLRFPFDASTQGETQSKAKQSKANPLWKLESKKRPRFNTPKKSRSLPPPPPMTGDLPSPLSSLLSLSLSKILPAHLSLAHEQ